MSDTEADGSTDGRRDCKDGDVADGPQPMRNCKPSKTTPNSVDQFHESHQAQYEARGQRSADRVEQVQRHNTAYPALWDELERRRSVTRVTAVKGRRGTKVARVCSACLKQNRKLKTKLSSRRQHNRNRSYKIKEYKSSRCQRGVDKRRKYNLIHRGLQSAEKKTKRGKQVRSRRQRATRVLLCDESRSDVGSLRSPSSEPSVSSYNSFPSLDHEPMVS